MFQSRHHVSSCKTNKSAAGYEEEPAPENYYARDYQDDYSPSPPHASGGSYYPDNNAFPPPPQPQPGFTTHTTTSTTHVNHEGIPPYNPADYANQPPHPDPYGYPPQTGHNVSANDNTSHQAPFVAPVPMPMPTTSSATPYFPPPPVAPAQDEQFTRDPFHAEEGASVFRQPGLSLQSKLTVPSGRVNHPRAPSTVSTLSPNSSPPPSPSRPHNKSVNFAPLSPTSSRRLAHIHENAASSNSNTHDHDIAHPDRTPSPSDSDTPGPSALVRASQPLDNDHVYDRDESPSRHRRRRRRNSDPSSDRPIQPSKHRRRHQQHSRSPSPTSSDEIEVLPDRFDRDGRPLDRFGNAYRNPRASARDRARGGGGGGGLSGLLGGEGGSGQKEMVEKLAGDFGDVMEGRKTWKDLLRGFVEEAGGAGGSSSGSERERERGSSGRRRRDR